MIKDTFAEKISLWLDDELSPPEVTELQAHLAGCPACRQTYEALQQIDRLFRTAARQMAAPGPGFSRRFEARLADHTPGKPWQIWLALSALLGGTLVLFGAWAIAGGITLVSVGASVFDAGLFYQWLIAFIESAGNLRLLLNLGALFLKVSFIVIGQPLFWVYILIALSLTWLWVRAIQALTRNHVITNHLVL